MKHFLIFCALAVSVAESFAADIHSPNAKQISITIYRPSLNSGGRLFDAADPEASAEGIALITEIRRLNLPEGESIIVFDDVAQTLVPQSASIESLAGVVSETNFDYSLISPGDIIANSIGQTVRVARTDSHSGRTTEQSAVLVAGPQGVLLNINGHLEALDCSGEHEKIIFPSIPEHLSAKPHLSAKVRVTTAGMRDIKLSYLATGFDWVTHYVARIKDDKLKLTGWVTLVNQQSTSFLNAAVDVVAGEVSLDDETQPIEPQVSLKKDACWFSRRMVTHRALSLAKRSVPINYDYLGSSEVEEIVVTGLKASIAELHELGDYKLYRLPVSTDVLAQQIKQVKMLEEDNIAFERIFVVDLEDEIFSNRPDKYKEPDLDEFSHVVAPTATIRIQNKKSAGLGKPIPAGQISVMQQPNASSHPLLIGENLLRDIPVDLPIDVALGGAENIDVQANLMRKYEQEKGDETYYRNDYVVTVTNHKPETVRMELRLPPNMLNDYRVFKESTNHHFKDGFLIWPLKIPAGKQARLSYTLEDID